MNIENIRNYCLKKKEVTESLPFGDDVLVFKVWNKIFVLMNLKSVPLKISVKTMPAKSLILRDKYWQITPGYHLNKKHWNTIEMEGHLPRDLMYSLIDESYELVAKSLPKKIQHKIFEK